MFMQLICKNLFKSTISKKTLRGAKKMSTASNKIDYGELYTAPLPVSTAKSQFLDCYRKAEIGFEVITQKRSAESVSILSTATVSALLGILSFTITETNDEGYANPYTVAIQEVPLYGAGATREDAIDNLIDATIEFVGIYKEQMDLFNKVYTSAQKIYMLKLLRCGKDRDAIRKAYGL